MDVALDSICNFSGCVPRRVLWRDSHGIKSLLVNLVQWRPDHSQHRQGKRVHDDRSWDGAVRDIMNDATGAVVRLVMVLPTTTTMI